MRPTPTMPVGGVATIVGGEIVYAASDYEG